MANRPSEEQATRGGEAPFMSIISALLFLYVGFGMGLVGISDSAVYNGSVAALVWSARIVGIGLLVVAGLTYAGLRAATLLDLLLSALATLACVVVGVVWLAFSDGQGYLLLLFALLNGSAARSAWGRWRARGRNARGFPIARPSDPEP